ncbi:MAG: branched-chain amino acid transport system II carrier protein [Weeksellaceae bacterium]
MEKSGLSIKIILITAFAMFSMMFGGGNFILPPLLGLQAGNAWPIVCISFGISGVFIPLLGILTQAKTQGTIIEMGTKIHPIFGLVLGVLMYVICLSFPIPRTAAVTYELAVQGYITISSFWFSIIYFSLVSYLCFNRNKILDILGKYLTPLLLSIIVLIIIKAVFFIHDTPQNSLLERPFKSGLLEGYQTFDGIASIIIGGVIVSSLNMTNMLDYKQKKRLIIFAGIISSLALFAIYSGFIYTGAALSDVFPNDITRTELLSGIGTHTLGIFGGTLLSISVSIACFTTAVGIIAGAADFMKYLFKGSLKVYNITVIGACLLGIVVGKTGTENIISVAVPVLVLIYPIVIMLIFLNIVPAKYTSKSIFRMVIITSLLFAIPDFLASLQVDISDIQSLLFLSDYNLAWLIPSLVVWIIGLGFKVRQVNYP